MSGPLLTQCCFLIFPLLLFCSATGDLKPKQEDDQKSTSLQLPPCEACAMVYESFMDAMKLTAQNHFGGGDTSWEEAKLGPYATSEVRLIEIQELLCRKKRAQDQCQTLVEEWEHYLEDWWFKQRTKTPDFFKYLCIDSLQLCCPSGHYGPECKPCPGFPNNICNNQGKCEGYGTRSGNGKCVCNEGFEGELCKNCAIDYFKIVIDDKLNCQKCDVACQGGCTSSGPQNCNNCAEGWTVQGDKGCVDIDECKDFAISSICKEQEFCVNTAGSYKCKKCDKACDGCSGVGPEHCVKCSNGHILDGDVCVVFDTVKSYSNTSRYITYLGLCVATFILFKNRPLLASFLGICIALCVTMTEYIHGNMLINEMFSSILKSIKRG